MLNSDGAGTSENVGDVGRTIFEHSGWVYHLGTNKIKREYSHRRFLHIKGKYVMMYKRNPNDHSGTRPIRRGVVGHTLVLEDLGCRKVNDSDLYVLKFSNRLDEEKKGEIACATAGETRKWMEALEQAKKQAEYELCQSTNARNKLSIDNEINLDRPRPKVKRYANGLKRLLSTKPGESLVPRSVSFGVSRRSVEFCEGDAADVVEEYEWKCVRTFNGVRIFEDVSGYKGSKGVLVKAVGAMEVGPDCAFEGILSLDRHLRYEWDTLTSDLELVDSISGNSDVVYGTYDQRYSTRWKCKRDFIFSRKWFRDQDGTYTILQFPAVHKKRPPKSGYRRTKINASTWEIRNLNTPVPTNSSRRCLVTHMLEVHSKGWSKWKTNQSLKFEKTIPFALLNQVSGFKAYIGAKCAPKSESSTTAVHTEVSSSINEFEDDDDVADDFYDAISVYPSSSSSSSSSSEDDDEDDSDYEDTPQDSKGQSMKRAVSCLDPKRKPDPNANNELDQLASPIILDPSHFSGSMCEGKSETDTNCWTSPSGRGFMIRGKTYLKDKSKVPGGDPLMKLIAVDWFKIDQPASKVALHPKCLVQLHIILEVTIWVGRMDWVTTQNGYLEGKKVQRRSSFCVYSDAGKKLPFIVVMNLQVPAKPYYSLVLYFATDRPVVKDSLLGRFIDENNTFRDSRFKLIPSIVEGYWMVKRAVGTKACLLGKALTCSYLRQDNFLEIDVDIGSSSVARSVIGIVLGYVTSIVVDLAILIEGKEQEELPEYILGTVRLNRVRLESAVPLES